MEAETFTWRPLADAQGDVTLRVRSAQFGDGYAQHVPDGINNKVQSWPLRFGGRRADIEPIIDFLDRHGGARAFYWTPPFGERGLYRAGSYTPGKQAGGICTLSVTFEQAFRP